MTKRRRQRRVPSQAEVKRGFTKHAHTRRLRHVWRAPLWAVTVGMSAVLVMVVIFGSLRSGNATPATPIIPSISVATTEPPTPSPTPTLDPAPTPTPSVHEEEVFAAAVRQVETRYHVQTSIAVTGIATPRQHFTPTWQAGLLTSAPAWGTMDVPITMALLRQATLPQDLNYMLTKAITESSSSADDALYSFLGSEAQAATATNTVLRAFGDTATTIPATKQRAGYSAFTQTQWPASSQAELAAQLYCSPDDWRIVSKMQFLDAGHSWGMGQIAGAYYKTSSGPNEQGRVIVRQLAIVPTSQGDRVGVGLAVQADDGTAETAQEAADALAGVVYFDATGFAAGHCAEPVTT